MALPPSMVLRRGLHRSWYASWTTHYAIMPRLSSVIWAWMCSTFLAQVLQADGERAWCLFSKRSSSPDAAWCSTHCISTPISRLRIASLPLNDLHTTRDCAVSDEVAY